MTLRSIIRKGVLTYILPSPYYAAPCVVVFYQPPEGFLQGVQIFLKLPHAEAVCCVPPPPALPVMPKKNHNNPSDAFLPLWPKNISKGLKRKYLYSQTLKASCPSYFKSTPYLNSLCHLYSAHHLVFSPQDLLLYPTLVPFKSGLMQCNVGDCCLQDSRFILCRQWSFLFFICAGSSVTPLPPSLFPLLLPKVRQRKRNPLSPWS